MWRPTELGQVAAERRLTVIPAEGTQYEAVLQFGVPVRAPAAEDGDPWWCCVGCGGLGRRRFLPIAGEDAVQALILALQVSRTMVPIWASEAGSRVFWLDGDMDLISDGRASVKAYEFMVTDMFRHL